MNIKLISGLTLLLSILCACTTTPVPQSSSEVTTLSNAERYQATVEAGARSKNVDVRWVNLPDEDDLDEYTEAETGNSN